MVSAKTFMRMELVNFQLVGPIIPKKKISASRIMRIVARILAAEIAQAFTAL